MATWYNAGSVAVQNGQAAVTGTGTDWVGAIKVGDAFIGPDGRPYEVAGIVSDTQLTLARGYLGQDAADQDYAIMPTRAITVQLAQDVQSLIADYADVKNKSGAGKFAAGTAAAPGMRFEVDQDTGIYRDGADAIGIATAGIRRMLLSSTAAQIDVPITGAAVQSSPLDGGAGKVLLRDAFGLGAQQFQTSALRLTDLNATNARAGRYGTDAVTVGTFPPGTSQYGVLDYIPYNSSDTSGTTQIEEIYYPVGATPVIWTRTNRDGVWSSWRQLFHTGNILAAVAHSGGVPTGGIIERGSNSNGEYVRFADGTQICTKAAIVDLTTAVGGDFTYPASFVTAPAASWSVQRGDLSVPGSEASALLDGYVIGGSTQWRFRTNGTGSSIAFNVALFAMGRWF